MFILIKSFFCGYSLLDQGLFFNLKQVSLIFILGIWNCYLICWFIFKKSCEVEVQLYLVIYMLYREMYFEELKE